MALALLPVSILAVFAWLCFRDRQYPARRRRLHRLPVRLEFRARSRLGLESGRTRRGVYEPALGSISLGLCKIRRWISLPWRSFSSVAFAIASLLLLAKIGRQTLSRAQASGRRLFRPYCSPAINPSRMQRHPAWSRHASDFWFYRPFIGSFVLESGRRSGNGPRCRYRSHTSCVLRRFWSRRSR